MKNMTEGDPLKLIFSFAVPLLLGNLLQQTYNMMDAAIVGRFLGPMALAGVGATTSVQFLVLGFCIGMCAGFGIPFATFFGAGRIDKMRRSVFNAAVIAVILSAVITLIVCLCCGGIVRLLRIPDNIYELAYDYLFIIFLGIPFTIFYNFLSSMMRAVGDSRTPFIFLAVSTVLNIVLDLLFILAFDMGVSGAALATVLAQGVSAALCFVYIRAKQPAMRIGREDMKLTADDVSKHLVMGIPMGLQYSITAIGTMVMQAANNGLGDIYISAFTAGSRIKQFTVSPFDAMAPGVSVVCSQNVGAGNVKRAREGIIKGLLSGMGFGVIIGAFLMVFGRTLSMIFIEDTPDNAPILDASGKYLFCLGIFCWSLAMLNICRMSVQGLGYSGLAIFSGVIEMIARIVVAFAFVPKYEFTAICFSDQTAWVSACLYVFPLSLICLGKAEKKLNSREVRY